MLNSGILNPKKMKLTICYKLSYGTRKATKIQGQITNFKKCLKLKMSE